MDLEALSDLSLGRNVIIGSKGQGSSGLGDGRVSSVLCRDLGVGEDGGRGCAGRREGGSKEIVVSSFALSLASFELF